MCFKCLLAPTEEMSNICCTTQQAQQHTCRPLFRSQRSEVLNYNDYALTLLRPAVCWRIPAASLLAQSTVLWLKHAAEVPAMASACHMYNTSVLS
jgi:hypothetical protein